MEGGTSPTSDELVIQFLSFTNTDDTDQAANYLEMSGGNVETAVGLYMEHNATGVTAATNTAPTGPVINTNSTSRSENNRSSNDFIPGASGVDDVRAPDEVRTMRLMDYEPEVPGMLGMHAMMNEEMSRFNPPSVSFAANEHFSAVSSNPFFDARQALNVAAASAAAATGDDDEEMDGGDDGDDDDSVVVEMPLPPRSRTNRTLSDMFAPPIELIHVAGGFQGARNAARDARRWLLVNIQRDSDFACHALNRDVWHDELVENLVREGFIFWQAMDDSTDGMTYAQRYNVHCFPHIAILDPRTARLMWKKEGWTQENPLTAEMFAETAADFCSRHTFDRPPVEPSSRQSKRPITEMTEEQQLQAAIRESMVQMGSDEEGAEEEQNGHHTPVEEKSNPKPPSFNEELLQIDVPDEPSGTEACARVQIRLPDGSRVVRKFLVDNTVKIIYAFVAQSTVDSNGKEFELRSGFPPRDLMPNLNDTIQSCRLNGESITVRWKS